MMVKEADSIEGSGRFVGQGRHPEDLISVPESAVDLLSASFASFSTPTFFFSS